MRTKADISKHWVRHCKIEILQPVSTVHLRIISICLRIIVTHNSSLTFKPCQSEVVTEIVTTNWQTKARKGKDRQMKSADNECILCKTVMNS